MLGGDVDLEDSLLRPAEADTPGVVAFGAAADEREVVDAEQTLGLTDRLLRGLDLEAVGSAATVAVEVDLALVVGGEQAAGVPRLDPAVVERLREDDDVPGEAVAADVGRLPDPARLRLAPQRVVDRAPVLGAAAVALAVGADDEQRLLDRDARRLLGRERGGEVEAPAGPPGGRPRARRGAPRRPSTTRSRRGGGRTTGARASSGTGGARARGRGAARAGASSARPRGGCRRARRGPTCRGTRAGSSCRSGLPSPRAARRSRSTPPRRGRGCRRSAWAGRSPPRT